MTPDWLRTRAPHPLIGCVSLSVTELLLAHDLLKTRAAQLLIECVELWVSELLPEMHLMAALSLEEGRRHLPQRLA